MKNLSKVSHISLLAAQSAMVFSTSVAANTPTEEEAWDLIRAVDIQEIVTETTYEVRKSFPEQVQGGITQFQLTGFVNLITSDTNVKEFILVSDMGFCPYCGDPDHGASLEIRLSDAAPFMVDGDRMTVMGNLVPVNDPETWQSFILQDAYLIK